jgi:hypothetical protein
MREREGLIARIRQIRRVGAAADRPLATGPDSAPANRPSAAAAGSATAAPVDPLEARIAHLEQLVEGLQDSVHREFERQGKLIADLQAQTQPGAMGAALDKDARDRGL